MSKCKNCKYWGSYLGIDGNLYLYPEPVKGPFKSCEGWEYDCYYDVSRLDAVVVEGKGCSVLTGPEFGCVLFEKSK